MEHFNRTQIFFSSSSSSSSSLHLNFNNSTSSLIDVINYLNKTTIVALYVELFLSVILNGISVFCIVYVKAFTPINILIINLATADILYASVIPFFVRQFKDESISQNTIGCRLSFILDVICMIVNVFTVAALTIERYTCIKSKTMVENDRSKIKYILIYIIMLWTSAICLTLPKALSIMVINENDSHKCISTSNDTFEQFYTISKLIIAFALPYTIIILFSIFLLRFLKEWSFSANKLRQNPSSSGLIASTQPQSRKLTDKNELLNSNNNSNHALIDFEKNSLHDMKKPTRIILANKSLFTFKIIKATVKKDDLKASTPTETTKLSIQPSSSQNHRINMIKRRTTRFVLAVVFSFLCCWSPLWIFTIIMTFADPKLIIFQIMSNLTLVIVYLGGVINPLLYMLLTQNFREYASEILKKIRKK